MNNFLKGGSIFFIILVNCHQYSSAQKATYDIYLSDKVIGEVTVSLTTTGRTQSYEIISDVNFKVLWKNYHRQTTNNITYVNGVVNKSFNSVYMNEEMEDSSSIVLTQNKYKCFRTPDDHFTLEDLGLDFTTARLYFAEPEGLTNIYSERFLEFCPLETIEPHKYKIHLPNGKHNFYTYKNGKLVEVFVDRTWFNLTFKPK